MTASVALQQAIRTKLVADRNVLGFFGAEAIFDRTRRPEAVPCIVLGDGHTLLDRISYDRRVTHEHASIHVWTAGEALVDAKALAGVVVEALSDGVGETITHRIGGTRNETTYRVVCATITSVRHMRDPSGRLLHAVIAMEALVEGAL